MGTRCLVDVYDEMGEKIIRLYRQYDGYTSGMGVDLARACNVRLVNGFGPTDTYSNTANGMGCFAARLVSELKDGQIGNVYLHAPNTDGDYWEEYVYECRPNEAGNLVEIRVREVDEPWSDWLTPAAFENYCNQD